MADDIVRDCVRKVKEMHPDSSDEQLLKLELTLRRAWGGAEVYVCKKPSLEKVSRLADCLAAGGSVYEAFSVAGVRGGYRYRMLARRHRRWLDY
jgi:hypothetical protein